VLQTGLLLVLGLAVAILAGLLLARRMTGPIRALDTGAARIGAGALDHRIAVHTGDELEELAERFNAMAGRPAKLLRPTSKRRSRTAPPSSVTRSTSRPATAEVLGVINSSPGDLGPVFDAMLEKGRCGFATRTHGQLFTHDGAYFHPAAVQGEPRYVEWTWKIGPVRPSPNAPLGRISRGERIVHVADITEDDVYRTDPRFPRGRPRSAVSAAKLQVALVKDATLLGAMTVYPPRGAAVHRQADRAIAEFSPRRR